MFGGVVKTILRRMFGTGTSSPLGRIKGTKTQLRNFEKALNANRNYIQSYIDNGLDNPATFKSKYRLETAVKNFERQTGIQWPFK